MKRKSHTPRSGRRLAVVVGFLAASIGAQASAASFPEYPLQTGTGSIPPNIMFILDDSGSMAWDFMPGAFARDETTLNNRTSPERIGASTSVHNKLYYNPGVDYRPWMQADGTRHSGGEGPDNIYTDNSQLSVSRTLASRDESGRTFYVPKPSATDLTNSAQYYRYQIRHVDNDGVSGLRVVRSDYVIATADNEGVVGAGCDAGLGGSAWRNCDFHVPTASRNEAQEIVNFSTWYSYHRTRSKVAKAGAAEAFGQLGENFRVGYDSIWNRSGSSEVSGDLPAYGIPVQGNDDGLFKDDNREDWFDYLYRANASDGTPLHGALTRTGKYYENETGASGPWGPQEGEAQLSCRQNYAILTTDGYWNSSNGFGNSDRPGDADSTGGAEIVSADGERTYQYSPARPFQDGVANTLADVAMHYWKRDLRPTLANNVPSAPTNPAFWQHMSTFGISIGLQGTMNPDDVQLIEQGSMSWPNPWHTDTDTSTAWNNESARRIDDLLHAATNSRGSFVAATNPQEFADALKDSLAAIARRRSSGSNVASNGPSLNNGSHLFQATYTSGEWSGDVSGISIVGGVIAVTPSWTMASVANDNPTAFRGREVYTWNGSSGVDFPTNAQEAKLVRNSGPPGEVTGAANANYIKGSRAREGTSPGMLRKRTTPIGDIVNSSPFYVPETDNLFIGANDGMLHGIDAANGTTLFSYVPKGLDFDKLKLLSSQDYTHHFFVDGGIDVTTRAQGKDKNILVASLGRGGKGVFALDVTQTAADSLDDDMVLWDRTFQKSGDTDFDADMGYVLGAPLVRQIRRSGNNPSQTVAIVPNGIESANGKAVLFIYQLNDDGTRNGNPIKIKLGDEGTSAQPNGLAEARAADVTGDGVADYIYAGDMRGNVWRVDVTGNPSNWNSSATRLFTATDPGGNRQPITSAMALAKDPQTGRIFVLFGTGSYITNGDLSSSGVQSVYAIIDQDSGTFPVTKTELQQRTIPITGVDSLGRAARAWEPYSALEAGARGWYVNLGIPTAGERVVTAPFVRGRALWFSSIIPMPGEGCDSGGTGYLNAVDAFTGTNPRAPAGSGSYTFIDVNSDGQGNDKIAGHTGGDDTGFITSVDLGIGMPSQGVGVGNAIYVCGSDAECGSAPTPPSSGGPARLRWRELVDPK